MRSWLRILKRQLTILPGIKQLVGPRLQHLAPRGHFYSPYPALDELKRNEAAIFERRERALPGIDLREREQLNLLEQFEEWYREQPFTPTRQQGVRYYFDNPAYSYSDALCLHFMIRHLQPRRIIEVGSGYSSCVMLDTNEQFFHNRIHFTLIEPYPELVLSLLKDGDSHRIRLVPTKVQDVDLTVFNALEANDILFIDSTHVSKTHSDVNRLFFEVLPRLQPGVHVHFHDIFYPFEYPKEWIYQGICWTEAYLLRAFLQFNTAFDVVYCNTFMQWLHAERIAARMPLCLKNPGGSIWIKKTEAERRFLRSDETETREAWHVAAAQQALPAQRPPNSQPLDSSVSPTYSI